MTGGRARCSAISVFLMSEAWSRVLPLTHSVMRELEAMAEPQPKVLNLASSIIPLGRDLDLKLHHVAAGRRAHQTGAHLSGVLVHGAYVAGIVVMIEKFVAV